MNPTLGIAGAVSKKSGPHALDIDKTQMAEFLRDLAYQVETGLVLVTAITRNESVGNSEYANSILSMRYYINFPKDPPRPKPENIKETIYGGASKAPLILNTECEDDDEEDPGEDED